MADDQMILIYSVFVDADKARSVAADLLENRMVACANILPAVTALYRWEGRVVDDQAAGVLFKTRAGLEASVRDEIARLHHDEVPVILTLNVARVNDDYLAWLIAETQPAP